MENSLVDINLEDRGISSNILVQAVIILVLLIFELVKHILLVAIGNILEMIVFIKHYLSLTWAGMVISKDILNELTSIISYFALFLLLIKWINRERHVIRVYDAYSKYLVEWISSIVQINFLVDNFDLMSKRAIVNVSFSFKSLDLIFLLWIVM